MLSHYQHCRPRKDASYNKTFTPGDEYIESETHDRTSIDLPAPQRALAEARPSPFLYWDYHMLP